MGLIVRGKYLITDPCAGESGIIENGAIYVARNIVKDIDGFPSLKERYPLAKVYGDGSHLVMPGLIDAHSHGIGLSYIQQGIPYDFLENCLIDWAYGLSISPELASMLSAIKHIRNGCTTMHHNNWGAAFDEQALVKASKRINAYQKVGIRLAYSPGIRNVNILAYDDEEFVDTLPADLQRFGKSMLFTENEKSQAIDYYLGLFEELYKHYNSDRCRIIFGPSWAQGSTDEFLLEVKARADQLNKLPIHIHILQTPIQKAFGIRKYGKSLLAHLDDLGLVDENLVCGHAVYLNQQDLELLAARKGSVTNHASCNLAVRNGIAPIYEYLKAGINVALGIDDKGINDDEDVIMELRMINHLNRVSGFDLKETPALDAFDILKLGTVNGAAACGFPGEIGRLYPGMKADVILVNLEEILNDPWASNDLNVAELFLYRAKGGHVDTVIIDGQVVMENREFLNIDVEELYKEIRTQAEKGLDADTKEIADSLMKIKPHYQKWYNRYLHNLELEPFFKLNSSK